MGSFFTTQRLGEPQFIAATLLLAFLAQCAWLVRSDQRTGQVRSTERFLIQHGLDQWHGKPTATPSQSALLSDGEFAHSPEIDPGAMIPDPNHSALYYLIAAAPLLPWPGSLDDHTSPYWGWLARAPGLFFGLCLGASVWYVARRLYGNLGGYIALVLFCFSPGIIRASAGWFTLPEMGAAWGAFGAIFTGIAVAHTLYAPREVVLWNWRRILLLGVALALGIGSQFSLLILIPLVLAFLLYLAPERKQAGVAIWAAACAVAGLILWASYGFRLSTFWQDLRHAHFLHLSAAAFRMPGAYLQLAQQMIQGCPALIAALPVMLVTFALWRRTRYFGNAAPLLIGVLFLLLGFAMPHYPGLGFRLIALPFFFLFIAGTIADLAETRYRAMVLPATAGLLASYALWSMLELGRIRT